jgi:hypothetical protein
VDGASRQVLDRPFSFQDIARLEMVLVPDRHSGSGGRMSFIVPPRLARTVWMFSSVWRV